MTPRQMKAARTWLGWSAQELADKAGVSVNTVGRYEAGGRIFRSTQRVIQRCLEDHGVRFVSCHGESGVMVRDVDGPENHDRAA